MRRTFRALTALTALGALLAASGCDGDATGPQATAKAAPGALAVLNTGCVIREAYTATAQNLTFPVVGTVNAALEVTVRHDGSAAGFVYFDGKREPLDNGSGFSDGNGRYLIRFHTIDPFSGGTLFAIVEFIIGPSPTGTMTTTTPSAGTHSIWAVQLQRVATFSSPLCR